jgi:hypothetical protein
MILFITIDVKTSNPTYAILFEVSVKLARRALEMYLKTGHGKFV